MSTKSVSKSGPFLLKKYPSMELPISPDLLRPMSTTHVPKRSFSFEFPTSPQPTDHREGHERLHFSDHHHHPLAQLTLPDLFTCTGCKEYGAGKRFACQQCDFQLHEFCALSPPSLNSHPLHGQHQLVFHSKSKPVKGGILWPKCDVCGKASRGFTFRCSVCSFQMHPCCAMLSTQVNFSSVHPHSLKLLPLMSSNGDPAAAAAAAGFATVACGECKRKRSGRVYRCTVCDNYLLHAVCAKNMINGLQANGIKSPPQKPNMLLGAAARIASVVVIDFIGGLVDGLGAGVGQALAQDIGLGGGRSVTTNSRRSRSTTTE